MVDFEESETKEKDATETPSSLLDRSRSTTTGEAENDITPQDESEQKIFPPLTTGGEPLPIIGGEKTEDFPECCAVGSEFGGYTCTGTLIAPNLVVTAKHCSEVFEITKVFLKGSDTDKPEKGETIEVEKEFNHPCADLKVLVLKHKSKVSPCHIAQGKEVKGKEAVVVGFGTINLKGDKGYGVKRMATVPIMSLGCDKDGDQVKYGCRKSIEMVAGHRGIRRDTCKGDSGGPLYIESDKGTYYLLGVTSRGLRDPDQNPPKPCGNGGIYIRVDQFIPWIEEVTGITIPGPIS
jgi:hypothetical protein